jgi:hypothetical protein
MVTDGHNPQARRKRAGVRAVVLDAAKRKGRDHSRPFRSSLATPDDDAGKADACFLALFYQTNNPKQ